MYYVPRVSSKSGQIVGIEESLESPTIGSNQVATSTQESLAPSNFKQLWRFKLDQMQRNFAFLKQHKCFSAVENSNIFFALQLSSTQLKSEDWATQLINAIDVAGIPGRCVEVELTEHDDSTFSAPIATYSMDLVRNAGVALALNNFPGSPLSFLSLAHWRFDKIKLNKRMIPSSHESLTVWSRKKDVLTGLTSMAVSMQTGVIVDGIEKETQFDFLGKLPISEWKGPFWGEPRPLSDLLPQLQSVTD